MIKKFWGILERDKRPFSNEQLRFQIEYAEILYYIVFFSLAFIVLGIIIYPIGNMGINDRLKRLIIGISFVIIIMLWIISGRIIYVGEKRAELELKKRLCRRKRQVILSHIEEAEFSYLKFSSEFIGKGLEKGFLEIKSQEDGILIEGFIPKEELLNAFELKK